MKKINLQAKCYGPSDIEDIASKIGAVVTNDAHDSKQCTIYALSVTDRELLSGAMDSLQMGLASSDVGFDACRRISEAMDQIKKVLTT